MICPDIWTLPPPNIMITHKHGRLNEKSLHQLEQLIDSHHFNRLISVVIPDTTSVPPQLDAILKDTSYYIVDSVATDEFVKRAFVQRFAERGQLYGLSVDTRIDVDNCAAITPPETKGPIGPTLHLSLNKELFQSLGLDGTVSRFTPKSRDRYNIRLNLLDPRLSPDTKFFARVRTALANDAMLERFTMRLLWQPPTDHARPICPSTLAKYFADAGYAVTEAATSRQHHVEYSLNVPLLGRDDEAANGTDGDFYATADDLLEYIGMLSLGCEVEPAEDSYQNSYRCLGRSQTVGNAVVVEWRGFFASSTLRELLTELRKYIAERPDLPWVSLYCAGFDNAPVSFGHKEHTVGMSGGDNAYTIVLSGSGDYLLTTVLASNKAIK